MGKLLTVSVIAALTMLPMVARADDPITQEEPAARETTSAFHER